jgi:hypothetical protein
MKKTLLISAAFLAALTASALMMSFFHGYDDLKEHSSDILIVRCTTNMPPPYTDNRTLTDDVNTFSLEVIAVIKGTKFSGSIPLNSTHWLNQGDNYLIFGNCENGLCEAVEDFRVIPLGRELYAGTITNAIAGKSPDEQLQILFRRAIDNLNRQMKKEQEEKERLEGFIRK